MSDQFQTGKAYYAIERDDGLLDIRDAGSFFLEYKDWADLHKQAISHVKGRILDVGCGVGKHALYLQSKGYDVIGIDRSPLAIEVCEKRGLRNAIVGNMENLRFKPDSFDTFLMMGNVLGLLGSIEKGRRLLKKWYPLLSKGGIIIADANDPSRPKSGIHQVYQQQNRRRGRLPGQLRIRIRYRQYKTEWFDYLLASREEVKRLLRGTGWRVREFRNGKDSYYIAIIEKAKR